MKSGSAAPSTMRRALLAAAGAAAGTATLGTLGACAGSGAAGPPGALRLVVDNVTGLYGVPVARIVAPRDTAEVVKALADWPGRVAVGGGRFSMGGQVAVDGGLHLDLRGMDRVVWFRPAERTVRVQAGMRWRDLQDVLDPAGLAVRTMQSYANFTVGGSVSVNAHGRYVGHGPMGHTVRALQLVLADGSVVEVRRGEDDALLRAAVGGYGAVGVITEVELDVADNVRIERDVREVPLEGYLDWFDREVHADPKAVLHNADLLPPDWRRPLATTWRKSDRPLTEIERLVPRDADYTVERDMIWLVTEAPGVERLQRALFRPLMDRKAVVQWLNHEASLDVRALEPWTRRWSTYALQEYFVPRRHFVRFARGMAHRLGADGVEALNVSIRHSPADRVSMLPWAKEEVFSFVLYYKQRTSADAIDGVGRWTRALIDLALACEGCYYLPYQPHATRAQFAAAYPEAARLAAVKAVVDPARRFSNAMWDEYA